MSEVRNSLENHIQDRNQLWALQKVGGAGRLKHEAEEDMPPPPPVKKSRKDTPTLDQPVTVTVLRRPPTVVGWRVNCFC